MKICDILFVKDVVKDACNSYSCLFWHGRLQQFTYWPKKELLMDEKKKY